MRVHWLVEELEKIGINEIMVTEYFSPKSQISRMELLASDERVETTREVIHRVGTTGSLADHLFFVEDYDPSLPSQLPLGKRTSKLEELRVKQLINFMLPRVHKRITSAFFVITVSILSVGIFIVVKTDALRRIATETAEHIQIISEATKQVESATLEEMLAVERFHRGEAAPANEDFRNARMRFTNAVRALREATAARVGRLDSLTDLEHQFHFIAGGMFGIVDSLSRYGNNKHPNKIHDLSRSHKQMMSSLDNVRLQLLTFLAAIELDAKNQNLEKQKEFDTVIKGVRVLLVLLALAAVGITIMVWFIVERKVSRPIEKLVAEANVVDTGKVR